MGNSVNSYIVISEHREILLEEVNSIFYFIPYSCFSVAAFLARNSNRKFDCDETCATSLCSFVLLAYDFSAPFVGTSVCRAQLSVYMKQKPCVVRAFVLVRHVQKRSERWRHQIILKR